MANSANVWADGFGVYHADIELPEGDTTPDSQLKAIVRKAIRAELGDQIGKGYRMRIGYVGMSKVVGRPAFIAVFKEV